MQSIAAVLFYFLLHLIPSEWKCREADFTREEIDFQPHYLTGENVVFTEMEENYVSCKVCFGVADQISSLISWAEF